MTSIFDSQTTSILRLVTAVRRCRFSGVFGVKTSKSALINAAVKGATVARPVHLNQCTKIDAINRHLDGVEALPMRWQPAPNPQAIIRPIGAEFIRTGW